MTPFAFFVLALAAWRTYALVSRDVILDWLRDPIAPHGSGLRDWLECPYCCGFWTAGIWATGYASVFEIGYAWWIGSWWALSAAVVFVELLVDRVSEG